MNNLYNLSINIGNGNTDLLEQIWTTDASFLDIALVEIFKTHRCDLLNYLALKSDLNRIKLIYYSNINKMAIYIIQKLNENSQYLAYDMLPMLAQFFDRLYVNPDIIKDLGSLFMKVSIKIGDLDFVYHYWQQHHLYNLNQFIRVYDNPNEINQNMANIMMSLIDDDIFEAMVIRLVSISNLTITEQNFEDQCIMLQQEINQMISKGNELLETMKYDNWLKVARSPDITLDRIRTYLKMLLPIVIELK